MGIDFWKKEYFLEPDLDELYEYVAKVPKNALFFASQLEVEYGEDLFYQLCCEDFPVVNYLECETALRRAFSEIIKQEPFVAYAADRSVFNSRNAKRLTGLEKSQLTALKNFGGCCQEIISDDDIEKLLLCTTRGLASTCALAVKWKILLLMQDLHGCIVFTDETDRDGLKRMVETLQKNAFVVTSL